MMLFSLILAFDKGCVGPTQSLDLSQNPSSENHRCDHVSISFIEESIHCSYNPTTTITHSLFSLLKPHSLKNNALRLSNYFCKTVSGSIRTVCFTAVLFVT